MGYRCKWLLAICLGFGLTNGVWAGGVPEDTTRPFREEVWAAIPALVPDSLPPLNQGLPSDGPLLRYWQSWSTDEIKTANGWALATLEGGPVKLGVMILEPAPEFDKKTVVIFFHGYASHNGFYVPFLKKLADNGYWVVAADLPGHGLSGGMIRGDVPDFGDYGQSVAALKAWTDTISRWQGYHRYAAGHSTGALSIFEYSSKHPGAFEKIVLGAPLVKSYLYGPTTFGNLLFGWIGYWGLDTTGDPLRPPYFPFHWIQGLADWNNRIASYPVQTGVKVLFIHGDADTVVEAKDNIAFLQTKFPDNQVFFLAGMSHVVFQQQPYRTQVWARVLEFLN